MKHGRQGVKTFNCWMPNGAPCPSKVQDGEGKTMEYDIGVYYDVSRNGMDKAIPPPPTRVNYYKGGEQVRSEKIETSFDKRRKELAAQNKYNTVDYSSSDFDIGFYAGAIGKELPYTNYRDYDAGKQIGKGCQASPIYTAGYNKGRDDASRNGSEKSNPYNEKSQKTNWLIWNQGYLIGNFEVKLSRANSGR